MDIFQFPDDYKPQKYLTSQQVQQIGQYLKNHPLFINQLPSDCTQNQHLRALMQLKEDQDPNITAQNLNKQANKRLKQDPNGVYHMKQAYNKYSQAIAIKCPDKSINAKIHANRAQLNLKLKNYGKVIIDCKQCLKFDSNYIKGYYRYAKALIALQKYQQCIKLLSNRNQPQLKQLLTQAQNKKQKKQKINQNKKQQQYQKQNQIKKYCDNKKWFYMKRDVPLPQGAKTQIIDGKLSIPLMIIYPQFSQFDLVAKSFQQHKLKDHLKQMIQPGLPWDQQKQYKMQNIQIYCQVNQAVLMKIPKIAKIGDILSRIPFKQALQLQIIAKGNSFYNTYLQQYKII